MVAVMPVFTSICREGLRVLSFDQLSSDLREDTNRLWVRNAAKGEFGPAVIDDRLELLSVASAHLGEVLPTGDYLNVVHADRRDKAW